MSRPFAAAMGLLLLGWAPVAPAEPQVRVRVASDLRAAQLSGAELRVQGRPLGQRAAEARAEGSSGVRVAAHASRAPLRVSAREGVAVNGRWFAGEIALVPRGDGRFDVVNVAPLEAYVARAAASEIYPDWPPEALKAQAVVARTYALHQRALRAQEPFDLEADILSQRYDVRRVPAPVQHAAAATEGEYMAHAGAPILAVFHSCAGGRTASAEEVWGEAQPYLEPVSSPDDDAPDFFWSYELARTDLTRALAEQGWPAAGSDAVEVVERSASGRVARIRLLGAVMRGRDVRELLGGRAIRSTLFDVRAEGAVVRFVGSGAGHGVGLSQWGARELARRGRNYREILAHYYPASELSRLGKREARAAPRSGAELEGKREARAAPRSGAELEGKCYARAAPRRGAEPLAGRADS